MGAGVTDHAWTLDELINPLDKWDGTARAIATTILRGTLIGFSVGLLAVIIDF
jgi:hypothetical protein